MSSPEGRGPIDRLFHGALLVLGAVVCLWLATRLIASIWLWLVGGVVLVIVGVIGWLIWRVRRNRW